ncbi:hypothetical protein [Algiphilus sp.]
MASVNDVGARAVQDMLGGLKHNIPV